jgi:hypothetical protein
MRSIALSLLFAGLLGTSSTVLARTINCAYLREDCVDRSCSVYASEIINAPLTLGPGQDPCNWCPQSFYKHGYTWYYDACSYGP